MDFPLKTVEQLRQQLRSLRKKRKLTQSDLGVLIGVTQARVVEIEASPGSVSLQQIVQVLHALGAGLVVRDAQVDVVSDGSSPGRPAPGTADVPARRIKKGSW